MFPEGMTPPFVRLLESDHPLISDAVCIDGPDHWPDYQYTLVTPCNFSDKAGVEYRPYAYLGAGPNGGRSAMSAVGEAVERYSALTFPLETHRATIADIGETGFTADKLRYYSDAQYQQDGFSFSPPTPDTEISWVEVTELKTGASRPAPRDLILLHNDKPEIIYPGSTGLAAHSSEQSAYISALCEVVERDATMLTWIARIPPRLIVPDAAIMDQLASFKNLDREIFLLDVTQDIPLPCIVCLSRNRSGNWPRWVASSACRLTPDAALEACLLEHAQALAIISDMLPREEPVPSLRQHAHLWFAASKIRDKDMRFFTYPAVKVSANEWRDDYNDIPIEDVDQLNALFIERDLDLYKINLTPEDMRQFGFHVVRVLCPGLQPMSFGVEFRCLGVQRLHARSVGGRLINSLPHPFP